MSILHLVRLWSRESLSDVVASFDQLKADIHVTTEAIMAVAFSKPLLWAPRHQYEHQYLIVLWDRPRLNGIRINTRKIRIIITYPNYWYFSLLWYDPTHHNLDRHNFSLWPNGCCSNSPFLQLGCKIWMICSISRATWRADSAWSRAPRGICASMDIYQGEKFIWLSQCTYSLNCCTTCKFLYQFYL